MKRTLSCMLTLAILLLALPLPLVAAGDGVPPAELSLHIGSPIVLSDGQIAPLDKENPDLVPLLHKGRTLVPLNFLPHFFEAEASFDAERQTATMRKGRTLVIFPMGESHYFLNQQKIPLGTKTELVSGHVLAEMVKKKPGRRRPVLPYEVLRSRGL